MSFDAKSLISLCNHICHVVAMVLSIADRRKKREHATKSSAHSLHLHRSNVRSTIDRMDRACAGERAEGFMLRPRTHFSGPGYQAARHPSNEEIGHATALARKCPNEPRWQATGLTADLRWKGLIRTHSHSCEPRISPMPAIRSRYPRSRQPAVLSTHRPSVHQPCRGRSPSLPLPSARYAHEKFGG